MDYRNSCRNCKGRLVWAFMNSVQIGFLTEQSLRNKVVERDLPCFHQFSTANLFASQAPSLKEIGLCLEIAVEANEGVFFLGHICTNHTDTFKLEQLIASSGLPHMHRPVLPQGWVAMDNQRLSPSCSKHSYVTLFHRWQQRNEVPARCK